MCLFWRNCVHVIVMGSRINPLVLSCCSAPVPCSSIALRAHVEISVDQRVGLLLNKRPLGRPGGLVVLTTRHHKLGRGVNLGRPPPWQCVHKLMSCDAVLAKNTALYDRKYIRNILRYQLIKLNITSCSTKKTKMYHRMKLNLTTTITANIIMRCCHLQVSSKI